MLGTALLIGAAVDGLSGVANDVEAMSIALQARGLAVVRCVGESASRAGIIAAYERLIADTGPGDAAVVYYSGHGGWARSPDSGGGGLPALRDLQFIVPTDYHASAPGAFRGITSVELSALLARLTGKTRNVTAVFDCCHAAHISRARHMRIKAISRSVPYERLRAHIDQLRSDGTLPCTQDSITGNPDAVRVVACAPEQLAFEYEGEGGRPIGMLTEALVKALDEAGSDRVTWATVMDRVRRRVLGLAPHQRPELEGPARRLLFDVAEDDPLTTLRVTPLGNGRVSLACAPLLGVQRGDTFAVIPPGAADRAEGRRVGEIRVDRAGPLTAEGTLALAHGWTQVPIGARAVRTATVAPALPVLLPSSDARTRDLIQAVAMAALLRAAEPDEQWLAAVRISATGELAVEDRIGPLTSPRPGDRAGVARVVRDLKTLAQASLLRGLAAPPEWSLCAPVTVEWGLVRDGRRQLLPRSGAVVRTTDRIYVSLRNGSADAVYVSLVEVGASGRVAVLTDFSPSGIRVLPRRSYVYGYDDLDGVLRGEAVRWPTGLDPAHARSDTVLLLVTSHPHDVSALGQDGVSRVSARRNSPLDTVLAQVATGRTRDLSPAEGPLERYDVHTIDFDLEPAEDQATFLLDERTRRPALRSVSRSRAPATVAVRVEELTIHRRRLVEGAAVRVDALVLTGGRPGRPAYAARTVRFGDSRDAEPLPLGRLLVYHGPARDRLDLAIWVSQDAQDGPDLQNLITENPNAPELREALTKLGEASPDSLRSAADPGAADAATDFVNLAYRLLRGSVGNATGVYRTSLLDHEKFGVGRHPESGSRRIQGFSLAYSVREV